MPVRNKARELLGLDLRSLAVLRIALGVLIIVDLALRSRDLVAHYTDAGVLPREAARQVVFKAWWFSLHMLGGSTWFEAALFVVAGVLAVFLIVGWRTRLMTLLSWLMMLSLHARNPAVLNAGDLEFKLLLFWGMFLPLGARWSIDRLLADSESAESNASDNQQYLSMGTLAYICQIVLIYLCAGLLKSGASWMNGTAVEQTLRIDIYGLPLRHVLLGHPDLMRWLTYCTLNLELYGWLLLLVPWRQGWFRLTAIVLFAAMHVGFLLTMSLGIFPWVSIAAWTALVPGMVWDNRLASKIGSTLHARLGQPIATFVQRLAEKHVVRRRPLPLRPSEWENSAVLFFLLMAVALNAEVMGLLRVPQPFRSLCRGIHFNQQWMLYAPNPSNIDGWCVVDMHLADGSETDFLTGREVTFERPENIAYLLPNHRWRKYIDNLTSPSFAGYRESYARYVGRVWNGRYGGTPREVETMRLIFMKERTDSDVEPPPAVQYVCWRHWYRDEFRSRFYPADDEHGDVPIIVLPAFEADDQ